jgi:UPF0271 protein
VIPGLQAFGESAFRMPRDPAAAGRELLEALRRVPGVVDAVVTETQALVTFEPPVVPSMEALARALKAGFGEPGAMKAHLHLVRARYDGADLDEVAQATRMTRAELVRAHAEATYEVAVVGFLPGFAYLRGLDPRLVVPRRATPRPRVPALSVAIAGPYTGVYPFASPGGWNLLGTVVGFVPFDGVSGARLRLGDRVRFEPQEP